MKYLLILTALLLTACGGSGGGSSQSQPEPEPEPPFVMPSFFTYEVQQVGETQKYQGRGVRDGNSIYLYPVSLGNSGYVVTGRIDYNLNQESKLLTSDMRLFGFIGSSILREAEGFELVSQNGTTWAGTLEMNGAEFDMVLEGFASFGAINNQNVINADWDEVLSSFPEEETIYLEHSDGHLSGYTTSGCNVTGSTYKNNESPVFWTTLQLTGCQFEGSLTGAYFAYDATGITRIVGSASNNQHGFRLFYDLVN